jgi:DNA-binding LytR/AlgR family response regulator
MKVLVVDDEAPARRRLLRLLRRIPSVGAIDEAASAAEALSAIERLGPDVLFLDVRMPGLDGIGLAERCGSKAAIVFVTAHPEHAVAAFDLQSVDYLLKPVRLERLEEAVRRVRARGASAPPIVTTHEHGATIVVDATTVTRFRACDKYTAYVSEGREHLTDEPLVSLEARLAPVGFMRVHRAELVRLSAVRSLGAKDGAHWVVLQDGQVVSVSRRMAARLRERLGI